MYKLTERLNQVVKLVAFWLVFGCAATAQAQQQRLTLQEAWTLARNNYPQIRQLALIEKTRALSVANLQKGFYPQLTLSGQASYQSDVTEVKVPLPGFSIEPPAKDQYKLLADLNQLIYDGGLTREQKASRGLEADLETSRVEVDLYKVRDRVAQLYLGILYLDEQQRQILLVRADIEIGMKQVAAQVENGVAFRSNLDLLKAEYLKAGQRLLEVKSARRGYLEALGLFVKQQLAENTVLEMPLNENPAYDAVIRRPELKLYAAQEALAQSQERMIRAKNLPRASLFFQGGYGRPGLNFLQNSFRFYYIGGLRLNWSLGGLYTKKQESEMVALNRQQVVAQQEGFLLNTSAALVQQRAEIDKLELLLGTDQEIILLRSNVKEAARAQLENGVITPNDYLREVNAEDQARQNRIAHQLQLLQARINYQSISGNY